MRRMWNVYHDEMPEFLKEFMEIDIMKRIQHVGMNCGCEYTSFPQFQHLSKYSRYIHSVGCALIIWHFTKDMKQTLSGLFHDAATPSFSHVIDFLNHDHMNQESTEEKTAEIMRNSKELMKLLDKYQIELDEICDDHLYPIANNDSPQLSADRLEYTLSNLFNYGFCTLEEIRCFYEDLRVAKNSRNEVELSFQSAEIACQFARSSMNMARIYVAPADRLAMQLLADVIELAIKWDVLSEADLYQDEPHVISLLDSDERTALMWEQFRKLKEVKESRNSAETGIWRIVPAKKRWINPQLVNRKRVTEISKVFKEECDEFLSQDFGLYIGTDDTIVYL